MLVPHIPTWEKLRVTLLNIKRKLLNEIYSVDNIIISDHAQGKPIKVSPIVAPDYCLENFQAMAQKGNSVSGRSG